MEPSDQQAGQLDGALQSKLRALEASLVEVKGGVLVAFSGGVDSALLLAAALRAANPVLAITMSSVLQPMGELDEARLVAGRLGADHQVLTTDPLSDPQVRANGSERCYHCKQRLYTSLIDLAREEGLAEVLDGSNVDDDSDFRPGRKALVELGVRSPLRDACLTKPEIRLIARAKGLPNWDRPAMACLASRIPYGETLTLERLERIDRGETLLRAAGFSQARLRDHGSVARLEVTPDRIGLLLEQDLRRRLTASLKDIGYRYVSVDLEGYRTGAMNEELDL